MTIVESPPSSDLAPFTGEIIKFEIVRHEDGTCSDAYLTFDEGKKGSPEPGKLADLAFLTADPLTIDETGLRDIVSVMTMVGGKTVHESPNWLD